MFIRNDRKLRMTGEASRPWIYDPEDMDLLSRDNRWKQRRLVADSLRGLKQLALRGDLDEDALARMNGELAGTLGQFQGAASIGGRAHYMARHGLSGPRNRLALEMSGVVGRSNAAALPMRFFRNEAGQFSAEVHPDDSHEGPPGGLHGGLVAALFDEFLGIAQDELPSPPGLTGTLSVRYLKLTPINQPLCFTLSSFEETGRKRLLKGVLSAGECETALCDALFIQPRGVGDLASGAPRQDDMGKF